VLAWSAAASIVIASLVRADWMLTARWAVPALALALLLPVPPRLRNLRGAFVLVIIPWLAWVVAGSLGAIGRWRLYEFGNDFWLYQRYGYRIVVQGYWLEGGSKTFYFQPFYRWITGLLHAAFGDSSVGERFWDGFSIAAGAMLAFQLVRKFAGFRWALIAAVLPLAVFTVGTPSYLIGFGLAEISSAGLLSMAALCAIRSRQMRRLAPAVAAGVLATLAFYTRLNNGIMALGIAVFALPPRLAVRDLVRPWQWWASASWRTAIAIVGIIAAGLLFFAWRTYHYTGVFSLFYGTQRYIVAIWQPGMPMRTVLERLTRSVLEVLTVNDPPRFDPIALPVLGGALVAVLSLAGVPRLRDLPATAVLFFVASIAGSFVASGWAYPGRFSVHILPSTCALTACAVARLAGGSRLSRRPAAKLVVDRRHRIVDRDVGEQQPAVVRQPAQPLEAVIRFVRRHRRNRIEAH
jgi:hypothetical protein